MKLGKEARDSTITFSITMPASLYDQLRPWFEPGKRSALVCALVEAGFNTPEFTELRRRLES